MAAVPHSPDARFVVALIATRDRFDLLSRRAVPSVLSQSRPPDKLVIVVDQSKEELSDVALSEHLRRLRAACGERVPLTVLRNRRTRPSASGAWNTGLDELHRDADIVAHPDLWFVAVLDDDDAWEPDHIRLCIDEAVRGDRQMVVAGLIRHEADGDEGHLHSIPHALDPRELFIRGQHIQGSNLFLRLDLFLRVGGFDERLQSCTDRDLCLRIAALGGVRFGHVERHTVHHYACPRADRVSTPFSPRKLQGLTAFWQKYADQFDATTRAAATARARERFGWSPETVVAPTAAVPAPATPSRDLALVVGFVSDARAPLHVRGLLDDLAELGHRPGVASLHVVVVENGPAVAPAEQSLRSLVGEVQGRGLSVEIVAIERQHQDWLLGHLPDTPDPRAHRLPIAASRTVLSMYVARRALECPGSAAWILDDDKRLRISVDRGDGVLVGRDSPDIAALCELRDAGVDVVIGPDTDAAPLPFVATLRTQLVDLEHLLAILEAHEPDSAWPDRREQTSAVRRSLRDSYYDLARSTEHLETPFPLAPQREGFTAADALEFSARKAGRLLAGEAPFRPLVVDAADLPVSAARDSVQRGGSALFFNPRHLLELPHTLARLGDIYVRRSDMLVSQLLRDQLGLKIVMHPAAAVRHDRSGTQPTRLGESALRDDVLGYAFYRTSNELMERRPSDQRAAPLIAWSESELRDAVRLVRKYIRERVAALTWNAWRILGLCDAVRSRVGRLAGDPRWCGFEQREQLRVIASEVDAIAGQFRWSAVRTFAKSVGESVSDASIRAAFTSMDAVISEYRACQLTETATAPAVEAVRVARACALVSRHFGTGDLRALGMGGEGVVLTDGASVFKVLDLLKRRPNHDTNSVLRDLQERLDAPRHLVSLTQIAIRDGTMVLVYPYEPSEPYAGGHGVDLLGLLRECKRHGVVFRNMHPKNLRVCAGTVRLIDYGSDIRPYSEDAYRSMAERAWLCWRWSHRPDLDQVMRRALTDKSIPELQGFERFWRALLDETPSATEIVAALVNPTVLAAGAKTVLDYGCGKHLQSVRELAAAGLHVVGFDPGEALPLRWDALGALSGAPRLTTSREQALAAGPFDAVICSMVLCELPDGPAYEQALEDLRAATGPHGIVVVAVCNPLSTFGPPTPLHRARYLPPDVGYEHRFEYSEHAETGERRGEFHRPLRQLERDLLRHGLLVASRVQSETVDTDRFEPASDFMILVCRPAPVRPAAATVSLLIKTCAMEASTIERQVEHLVSQLEGPRTFAERILAIDSRRGDFVRQHAAPDLAGVEAAALRLVARGLIDRVIRGPEAGSESRAVLQAWFAIDSESTHTSAGVPLAMPLHAVESCAADYVLQVDSDLLVGRADRTHDYLGEMIEALERDPAAVTASLNVPQRADLPFSAGARADEPWRVEVRGCLFHRHRLLAGRPYVNDVVDDVPTTSWYRSLDHAVREGRIRSLRGGGRATWFVHVPNDVKRCISDWMLLHDLAERGHVNEAQFGRVDLVGGPLQWVPKKRSEELVFVITGRNVPTGRMQRCIDSLKVQTGPWAAVVIDDGSSEETRASLAMALEPLGDRVTLLQPRERRGQLANLTLAIRHVCTNPDAVIVTLDLDDALLGPGVAERVLAEHRSGADVTVGSMLRTDKHASYPVDFAAPRARRGGNCWQHLRSFRKRLFDAIPDHDLRIDQEYVGIAVDWAFMIPIVEMATQPVWIREPLYLYEPSGMGKGPERAARERQIAAITARPSRPRLSPRSALVRADELEPAVWNGRDGILFLRHAERPSLAGLDDAQRNSVRLTTSGLVAAQSVGRRLGDGIAVASSPVARAVETAQALVTGAGGAARAVLCVPELVEFRACDKTRFAAVKSRLGWSGLMHSWTDGSISREILMACDDVSRRAISAALRATGASRVVAVTHDFMIVALLAALRGERITFVPYLAGVFVGHEDVLRIASDRRPS